MPAQMDPTQQQPSIETGPQRIRVLPGASDTAASFQFDQEDHTLGNALRYMIMKKYDLYVELCGYSIPHPSEAKMNLRIQTYGTRMSSAPDLWPCTQVSATEGTNVYDALEKGFDDLMDLCDVVTIKFAAARTDFAGSMDTR
ncbi:MAG: hypothetical protein Q9223_000627 [Gallowayella weberi]